MNKRSKSYQEGSKLVDITKVYPAKEALELVQQTSKVKFDAGVEVHIRLGIDPKKADQVVRSSIQLPHGTGKTIRIAVFAEEKDQAAATKAGAAIVGGEELIKKIKTKGKIEFDVAIATTGIMKQMGQIAKILGPKGLMPSPRSETVVTDVAKAVADLSGGKVTFRNDDSANIHQLIGRVSFGTDKLLENYQAFIQAVRKLKPATLKGGYIKNISISASMGPGIKVTP